MLQALHRQQEAATYCRCCVLAAAARHLLVASCAPERDNASRRGCCPRPNQVMFDVSLRRRQLWAPIRIERPPVGS